jgi:ribosomal-protein-alanine N-acetyltransferase
MAELLRTARLLLRDWSVGDAPEALKVYRPDDALKWETNEQRRIPPLTTMQQLLERWTAEQADMAPGTGRWAMTLIDGGALIGGITLLPMPVPEADVEIGYRLAPEYWGRGYATEAGRALAQWAFQHLLVEVFGLVTPDNVRAAATARRIGMEWVGESTKYHGMHMQVYRLRPDNLAHPGDSVQLSPTSSLAFVREQDR